MKTKGTEIMMEIIIDNKKIIITDNSDPRNLVLFDKALKKIAKAGGK